MGCSVSRGTYENEFHEIETILVMEDKVIVAVMIMLIAVT